MVRIHFPPAVSHRRTGSAGSSSAYDALGEASGRQAMQEARPGVQVKLLVQEGELYVLAQSREFGINAQAPAGKPFAKANAAIYAMAVDKAKVPEMKSLQDLINADRRDIFA